MHMKKILIILTSLLVFLIGVQTVFAQSDIPPGPYGLGKTAEVAFGDKLDPKATVQSITGNVIGSILAMIGVLFLALMIYGGVIWMIARGNEQQTQKALNTIIAAVIGLVIVLASYAITNFVFTSVNDTTTAGANTVESCVDLNTPASIAAGCASVTCSNFTTVTDCATDVDCCIWQII